MYRGEYLSSFRQEQTQLYEITLSLTARNTVKVGDFVNSNFFP